MSITTRTRTRFSHALYFRVYFGKQQQTAVSGPQARLGASDGDARGLRSLGRARQTRATTRPDSRRVLPGRRGRRRRRRRAAGRALVPARGAARRRAREGRVHHVRVCGLQEPEGRGRLRGGVGESSTAIVTATRPLFSYPPASSAGASPAPASLTIAIFASSSLSPRWTRGLSTGLPRRRKFSCAKGASSPASASGVSPRASWSSARRPGRARRGKRSKNLARR